MKPVDVNPVRNRRVAVLAATVAAGMAGLAYASVPLYAMFCQATGFGGTTQRAAAAPAQVKEQTVTVRFDANIAPTLNWSFDASQSVQTIRFGEQVMAYYRARNLGTVPLTGTAVFNVSPPAAGIYFNKIQCFCFTEQTLKPGETVELPVSYFVDPAMLNNADARGIREITLSYTFYPAETNKSAALQSN